MPSPYTVYIPFPDNKLYVSDFLRSFTGGVEPITFNAGTIFHLFLLHNLQKPYANVGCIKNLHLLRKRKEGIEIQLKYMDGRDPRTYNHLPRDRYLDFVKTAHSFFLYKFYEWVSKAERQNFECTFAVDAFMKHFKISDERIQASSLERTYRRMKGRNKNKQEIGEEIPFFLPKSYWNISKSVRS